MKKKIKLIIALLFGVVAVGYIAYQSITSGQGYYLAPSELIARARTDRGVMVEGTYMGGSTLEADDIFNWFFSMSTSGSNEVLYVLSDRNIDVLEAKTGGTVATIKAGSDQQLAVAPDGKRLYLADVPESGPGKWRDRLRVIETQNYRTIAQAELPGRVITKSGPLYLPLMSLSPDGKRLYVIKTSHHKRSRADFYNNWVSIISATGLKEVGRVDLRDTFARLLWADKHKLVLGLATDRLGEAGRKDTMIVDLGKRKLVGELTRPESDPVWARGAATTDGVTFYYIEDKDGGGAARIDVVTAASLASPTVIRNKELDLPPGWQASGDTVFSKDGSRLYIGVGKSGNTSRGLNDKALVFDSRKPSLPLLGTIKPRGQFTGMAASGDSRRLYLLNGYKKALAIYNIIDASKPRLEKAVKLKGLGLPSAVMSSLRR